jgi:hypothetical protein
MSVAGVRRASLSRLVVWPFLVTIWHEVVRRRKSGWTAFAEWVE